MTGRAPFFIWTVRRGDAAGTINGITLGNPAVPPGTVQIGEIVVNYGENGKRVMVEQRPDNDASLVVYVNVGSRFPCYAAQNDQNGRTWYYIRIEEVSKWGWISPRIAALY